MWDCYDRCLIFLLLRVHYGELGYTPTSELDDPPRVRAERSSGAYVFGTYFSAGHVAFLRLKRLRLHCTRAKEKSHEGRKEEGKRERAAPGARLRVRSLKPRSVPVLRFSRSFDHQINSRNFQLPFDGKIVRID